MRKNIRRRGEEGKGRERRREYEMGEDRGKGEREIFRIQKEQLGREAVRKRSLTLQTAARKNGLKKFLLSFLSYLLLKTIFQNRDF